MIRHRRRQKAEGSWQKPEGRSQNRAPNPPTAYCNLPAAHGFTLVEMLVVMGIIVLAMTLAVPTLRYLTGSNSQQAAQNVISSYVASVRADAIGSQDVEGLVFYIDPSTGRVACQEVAQSPPNPATNVPGVIYLDLEGGPHPGRARDALLLPPGVLAFTIKDTVPPGAGPIDPFAGSGSTATIPVGQMYLGFNSYVTTIPAGDAVTAIGGVILFDGDGRLYTGRYGFRFLNPSGTLSALGALVFVSTNPSVAAAPPTSDWPSAASSNSTLYGQLAFSLTDRETFLNQHDATGTGNPYLVNNDSVDPSVGATPRNFAAGGTPSTKGEDWWLNTNATPIFVDRYNGSLIRAE